MPPPREKFTSPRDSLCQYERICGTGPDRTATACHRNRYALGIRLMKRKGIEYPGTKKNMHVKAVS